MSNKDLKELKELVFNTGELSACTNLMVEVFKKTSNKQLSPRLIEDYEKERISDLKDHDAGARIERVKLFLLMHPI
jgi:hypothetical protein